MRAYIRTVLLACLLSVVSAAPAHAGLAALIDMLDNLSGPGPFRGVGFQVPFFCNYSESGWGGRCFWPLVRSRDALDLGAKRFDLGAHFSWMDGEINPDLIYPDNTLDDSKEVDAFTYGLHATWTPRGIFGATVRYTRYRFDGELVLNDSQTRAAVALGPIISLPPRNDNPFRLHVSIVPLVVLGLGEFTPEDFGALAPAFESDNVKYTVNFVFGF